MDNRDDYAYGWNEKGERFHALKSGKREQRVNMIAVSYWLPSPLKVLVTWLKNWLIPVVKLGKYIVIDNATFDKGGRILELIEQAGCQAFYLPPYSPDFNEIEQCWSWIKSRIRQCLKDFPCLRSQPWNMS